MTLALQAFENSNDTREKLRLNFHSLSVSELLEYGRKTLLVVTHLDLAFLRVQEMASLMHCFICWKMTWNMAMNFMDQKCPSFLHH
jgi:hypothetical protein